MEKEENTRDSIIENTSKPKYISIEISERCNLKCNICNQWKESNSLKKLEFKHIKKLIDELKAYFPDVILEFSGPEPLMNKRLLFDSLSYAALKRVKTALSTNGLFLSEKNVKALLNLDLNHISVSLDGSDSRTNDYIRNSKSSSKMIVSGLKRLVNYKFKHKQVNTKISVTCVINDKNVNELTELYSLCRQLGVDSINYNAYVLDNSYFLDSKKNPSKDEFWVKKGKIPQLMKQIEELIKIKTSGKTPIIATKTKVLQAIPSYFEFKLITFSSCLAGFNYFHITNFGEVTVCGKGPHLNIKKKNINQIWNSKEFQKTRELVKSCRKLCLNNCFRLD